MSAREFKPGDVGTSRYGRVFNTERGWVFDDDSGYMTTDKISGFRPLVVIDPEDREQVERLSVRFHNEFQGERRVIEGGYVDAMQAALREFLDPKPRIEEPTGLGAVVEAAHEEKWLRFESYNGSWWRNRDGENKRWADLDVVRVLSEGVTA